MTNEYVITEDSYNLLSYKVSKMVDIENLREMFKIFETHKHFDMHLSTSDSTSK